MSFQTDFRPQLHGFDFANSWDLDQNYANFVRGIIENSLPLAVKAVVTDPAILAELLGIGGIAIGLAEALIPGFDLIVIGLIAEFLTNTKNVLKDLDFQMYGACGGMAYASTDYFMKGWVIPKGIFANGNYNSPPVNDPNAKILRDYIFSRFEDSWKSGGVLDQMLEWYILLKMLPSHLGGGGKALQKKTKPEWTKLTGLLDQRKPSPIALIFDDYNIFDNHQVVAYGYSGDPAAGPAYINIYDDSYPDAEYRIQFDFTQSEMQGILLDGNGNRYDYENTYLKGFFPSKYAPETPPIGWGLQAGMRSLPPNCGGANTPFAVSYAANNNFTSAESPGETQAVLVPLLGDAANLNVTPADYQHAQFYAAYEHVNVEVETTRAYADPGIYMLFSKVWLAVMDTKTHVIQNDSEGQPLQAILLLPASAPRTQSILQLRVFPNVAVRPVAGVLCRPPLVEGGTASLTATDEPFGSDPVSYQWTVVGATAASLTQQVVELTQLPGAGGAVTASVVVRDTQTGCTTTGSDTFTVVSAAQANEQESICLLQLQLAILKKIEDEGWDVRNFAEFQPDLDKVHRAAEQIFTLSGELLKKGK